MKAATLPPASPSAHTALSRRAYAALLGAVCPTNTRPKHHQKTDTSRYAANASANAPKTSRIGSWVRPAAIKTSPRYQRTRKVVLFIYRSVREDLVHPTSRKSSRRTTSSNSDKRQIKKRPVPLVGKPAASRTIPYAARPTAYISR